MAYSTKVYIVQRGDGTVIAAKLSFEAAHKMAKANAPAKVLFAVADKSTDLNVVGHASDHAVCK
ncbi:hypothetical protein RCZAHN_26 [Rhodobacter phage RcZahn]|nr:hypothetical protein RCZAHN_26 [Rhodobacter phage RcZahn]